MAAEEEAGAGGGRREGLADRRAGTNLIYGTDAGRA
jgi:hypothetical protein